MSRRALAGASPRLFAPLEPEASALWLMVTASADSIWRCSRGLDRYTAVLVLFNVTQPAPNPIRGEAEIIEVDNG